MYQDKYWKWSEIINNVDTSDARNLELDALPDVNVDSDNIA